MDKKKVASISVNFLGAESNVELKFHLQTPDNISFIGNRYEFNYPRTGLELLLASLPLKDIEFDYGNRYLHVEIITSYNCYYNPKLILRHRTKKYINHENSVVVNNNRKSGTGIYINKNSGYIDISIVLYGKGLVRLNSTELTINYSALPKMLKFERDKILVDTGFVHKIGTKDDNVKFLSDTSSLVVSEDLNKKSKKEYDSKLSSTQLYLTIDTEDTYFEEPVMMTGKGLNIPCTLEISEAFSKRNLKGVFFTNVYEQVNYQQKGIIAEVMKELSQKGHEVALHCHQSLKLDFYCKNITLYNFSDQCRILEYGKNQIYAATGIEPVSFRGGGYQYNMDTLKALNTLGFKIDSSYLFNFVNPELSGSRYLMPHKINDVLEVPITYIPQNLSHSKIRDSKLDINWMNANELIWILENGIKNNRPVLNFMMHSFSFIRKKRLRAKEVKPGTNKEKCIMRSPLDQYNGYIEIYGEHEGLFAQFETFLDYVAESSQINVKTMEESYNILSDIAERGEIEDSTPFLYRKNLLANNSFN